jgi:hypothetical protein
MQLGVSSLLVAMACAQVEPASYQTANFVVYSNSPEAARQIGDAAEQYRKELAKLWLGAAQANWAFPCRIDVQALVLPGGPPMGLTEISFTEGKVLFQKVDLKGPLHILLKGPLPHELTHVLFAHHFGVKPPRWADEGGAIVSEGNAQGDLHRKVFRRILAEQRQFGLRELLGMQQYPADIPCLYAQGHSVARFLVATKGHKAFLDFVREGVTRGWDTAANEYAGYANVEQMEKAWLTWVTR